MTQHRTIKISRVQPYVQDRVLGKIWDWADKNFSKLTTHQKLQIFIALGKQSMPNINQNSGEIVVKVEHQELEDRLACYSLS